MSVAEGEADAIGGKADLPVGMSAVGGGAVVAAAWSEQPLGAVVAAAWSEQPLVAMTGHGGAGNLGLVCGHNVRVHRHDNFTGRHDILRKCTLRFRRESFHRIVTERISQR